jgi:hypothetical protein
MEQRKMSDGNDQANYGSQGNEGKKPRVHAAPYWRRMHRSWPFWVGMVLVTAAITMYVMSDNLALIPRSQPQKPQAGQLGQ